MVKEKADSEPWFKRRPHRELKNNLEGKRLNVFANHPPTMFRTPKGAQMNQLIVWDKGSSESYKVLVTDIDLDAICKIVSENKDFTFVPSKTSPWAEVAEFVSIEKKA